MKIAVIGAGEMGGAFATGLLKTDLFKPEDITVTNPHEGKLKPFAEQGTSVTTDNKMAAALADIVVLAVKPKVVKGVIDEIKEELEYSEQTIVNMAASIKLDQLEAWLISGGDVPPIWQAIPNIGIAHRQSMTFLSPNDKAAANPKWQDAALPTYCVSSGQLPRPAWNWASRLMMPRTLYCKPSKALARCSPKDVIPRLISTR